MTGLGVLFNLTFDPGHYCRRRSATLAAAFRIIAIGRKNTQALSRVDLRG